MEIANEIRSVYGKIKKQVSRLFLKRRVGFLRFWISITFAQRCYFLATSMLLGWYASYYFLSVFLTAIEAVWRCAVLASKTLSVCHLYHIGKASMDTGRGAAVRSFSQAVGLLSEFSSESANPLISIENVTENELENGEAQLTKEQEEDISELEKDLTTLLTITVQEVKKPACSNLHAGF